MNRSPGVWIGGFLAIVLLCIVVIPTYVMDGHAVSIRQIEAVKTGDTTDEVMRRFCRPSRVNNNELGESWVYSGFTWCIVKVQFDSNGLVHEVVHDH